MIDITAEEVLTLTEATKHLPRRRAGKRPHVATLYRWANTGVKGVRLETIQVGGTLCTSLEAVQRFCERLTATPAGDSSTPPAKTRQVQIKDAQEALRRQGIL